MAVHDAHRELGDVLRNGFIDLAMFFIAYFVAFNSAGINCAARDDIEYKAVMKFKHDWIADN